MTLRLISAQEILFDGEVTSVTLPGAKGEFTVLRNHASLLSTLTPGKIRYTDAVGAEHSSAITGGIADIDSNIVTVCLY